MPLTPPIRTLVVDDERLARENLVIRLREVGDFDVVGECEGGLAALEAIDTDRPELVFLDIRMPDLGGFELLERIAPERMPVVVFVTAYDHYALEAFRVHALDYLLKPFDDERFAETLALCRRRVAAARREMVSPHHAYRLEIGTGGATAQPSPAVPTAPAAPAAFAPCCERLIVKGRGRVFFIRTDQVEWVAADGDYVRLHVAGQAYLLRRTMQEMEARLDPRHFARVSRSAIVNLDRVRELTPLARGEYRIHLRGGSTVKLTRTYRTALERHLGDRL